MDQIMGKVGGYWFNQKAGKEMNNIGDDINVSHPLISSDSLIIFSLPRPILIATQYMIGRSFLFLVRSN